VWEVGGYDTEDISGKPLDLLKMFTPESIERMSSVRDMILSGKKGAAFECELYTKSGTKMSLELNVGPFLLNGRLFGIVAVMRDITERKRAEEALRESEERFRTVFEGTSLGIALVDFNGKALSINHAFEQMTGYSMEEFKEIEGSLKYLHPDDAMMDAKLYIELLKGKREGYTVDKRYIRKDGGVIWGRQTLSVVRGAEGKPIYFVAMVEDITERKRMEDSLRESEERHRLYLENVSDVIYSVDPEGTILSMSPSVERSLGYKPEELIGKNVADLNIVPPEKLEQGLIDTMRALAGERFISSNSEFLAKDGSVKFGEISGAPIFSKDGNVIAAIFVARDITERKKMEEALRESEGKYRLYFENASDVIYSLDPEGTIMSMSPAVEKMLGYKPEELIGKNIFESNLQTPETMEKALFNISRVLAGEHGLPTEGEFIAKDGTRIFGEISGAPIFSSEGKVIAVVCVGRDITERKRIHEAMRTSEERLRIISENMSDLVSLVDSEGNYLYLSPVYKRMFGDDPDHDLGKNVIDFAQRVHPDDREKYVSSILGTISNPVSGSVQYRYKHASGNYIWVESQWSILTGENGQLTGAVIINRDISERKRMEDALKQSEQDFRTLFDTTIDGMAVIDKETLKILLINQAIINKYGKDIIGMNPFDLLAPEERERALKVFKEDVLEKDLRLAHEYRAIAQDGSELWISVVSTRTEFQGRPAVLVSIRSITEQKRAEEQVRLLSDAVKMSKDSIVVVDLEGRIIEANDATLKMHRLDNREDLIGKLALELIVPQDHEMLTEKMTTALAEGGLPCILEYHGIKNDGSTFLGEATISELKDTKGECTGYMSIIRDITERKRMEDALRQSEQDYRTLFDTTIDGMAVIDAETMRVLLINQPIMQKYGSGLSEDIFKGNLLDFVHPEDRERALKLIVEDLFEKDARKFVKIRLINSDGKMFWASCTGARIKYQGRPAGLVSLRDITEQQEAEDALRDSEERFRRLSDQAPDIIFRFSNEKGLEYCSPIVFEITGYTAEELLAEPKIGIELAKGFDAGLAEDYEMSVTKGVSMRTREISFVHKDGRRIYLDMRSHAVRDKEGNVIAYEGILRDITERKRMEEELHLLSDAVRMTAESVSIIDLKGRIVDINEAGLKMQGLENKADLVGKNPFHIIIPEDQPKALETMAKILAEHSLQTVEYHIVTNDGRKAIIETSVSLIRGEKGEPKSIVAVARDITERKRIEEALRESEKRYRLLAENLRDVIWTVDMNWCLTYVSPSITQLAGYSVEEYLTKNWDEMVAPASVELLTNIFAEELALEADGHSDLLRSRTFEVALKCKDGSTVPVEMKVTFLRGPDGRPAGILGVSRDITARKKAEEEKQKLEEQLQLAGRLAAVGELAAGVAHELNNPIAAIKGFAQFLTARKDLDVTIRKDLDTIFRESQRAAKITQNLLSFARRHEPEKHPVSINDVIENILEMQEHMMKVNNIELEVDLKPDLPKTMADFHQMQQVFMNIVNNAEQAMIEAHGKGRLLIKTQRSGNMVQITFADNGPGISKENLKRIFDPFFTTKEVGKGTGLGLSICYGLIESHGGRIYAKSKLGQGATFVVEMPIVSEKELVAEAALLNPALRGVKWNKP
jgi:PAS domain S-box-containing protein